LRELKLGQAEANEAKMRRACALQQLKSTIVDYAAIFCALLVLLAPWRSLQLLRRLNLTMTPPQDGTRTDGSKPQSTVVSTVCRDAEDRHAASFGEALNVLIDLPCIVAGAVVLLTGWRSRLFLRTARLCDKTADANHRRSVAVEQFCLLLRDVPFFPLFVILVATLYRFPNVVLKLTATQKRLLTSVGYLPMLLT
jgi:hypothetical protein